jgi:hypothetical protein
MNLRATIGAARKNRAAPRLHKARKSATRTYFKARLAAAKRFASRPRGAPKAAVPAAGVLGAASAYILAKRNGHGTEQPASAANQVTPKNGEVGDLQVGDQSAVR